MHPTESFAILQTAIYDAVVSTTHCGAPYAFEVATQRGARPDAAADQATHDVLAALFRRSGQSSAPRSAASSAAFRAVRLVTPGVQPALASPRVCLLTSFFGSHVDLTIHSDASGSATVVRTFPSFQAAAEAATLSRIVAGQHTSIDEDAGTNLGRHVAEAVLARPFGHR